MKLVFQGICNFLKHAIKRWIVDDESNLFIQRLHKWTPSPSAYDHRWIFSLLSQTTEYTAVPYNAFCCIWLCILWKWANWQQFHCKNSIQHIFTQATCYLPISSSTVKSSWLIEILKEVSSNVLKKIDSDFNLAWIMADQVCWQEKVYGQYGRF